MRLLLDTHVFLWCIKDNRRLNKSARSKILDASVVYVSSASIWEASIKIKIKKLDANIDQMIDAIAESGFLELPITARHAAAVNQLADIHRDPFDRILISQAIFEPLTLLTADAILKKYSSLVELVN
ncbi:MAG: type II toxin-antitoxin system VapC family toxin [Candidatus Protochlamydia sp.]|nr:type II toxin-antitoxin system VapC family toxin [Candidatus Protochlamydia sp.]